MKKTIEVVAAVIRDTERYLCFQKGEHKYEYIRYRYEFPGGKIEAGESREEALLRELDEELDMQVSISRALLSHEYEYPDFCLRMHSFLCELEKKDFLLREHIAYQALALEELQSLAWAAADLPVLAFLQQEAEAGRL